VKRVVDRRSVNRRPCPQATVKWKRRNQPRTVIHPHANSLAPPWAVAVARGCRLQSGGSGMRAWFHPRTPPLFAGRHRALARVRADCRTSEREPSIHPARRPGAQGGIDVGLGPLGIRALASCLRAEADEGRTRLPAAGAPPVPPSARSASVPRRALARARRPSPCHLKTVARGCRPRSRERTPACACCAVPARVCDANSL